MKKLQGDLRAACAAGVTEKDQDHLDMYDVALGAYLLALQHLRAGFGVTEEG